MAYAKPAAHRTGLRLHFNENTAGCSPAVLEALRSISREDASLYPDYGEITAATARYFGMPPGWVQLTNGLDEGLHVVAQWAATRCLSGLAHAGTEAGSDPAYAMQGQTPSSVRPDRVLVIEPAFEMYGACAEAAGLGATHILPEDDFRFPLDAILSTISPDTRVVYLTDPNNPTGLAVPPGAVEQIAAATPSATILVDEAYAEFSGRTFIGPALERQRNLIVGRTFAKAHGLAALRVGALIAHPDTLDPLRRILPPYSMNICAIRALAAALGDRPYLEWYVSQSVESRRLIYAFCDARGLKYWPSEANFVLLRIGTAASDVVATLAKQAIFIRDRSNSPGCAGCVRITAGVIAHAQACLTALEGALASSAR